MLLEVSACICFCYVVEIFMKTQKVLELCASHLADVVGGHVATHVVPLVISSLVPRVFITNRSRNFFTTLIKIK